MKWFLEAANKGDVMARFVERGNFFGGCEMVDSDSCLLHAQINDVFASMWMDTYRDIFGKSIYKLSYSSTVGVVGE